MSVFGFKKSVSGNLNQEIVKMRSLIISQIYTLNTKIENIPDKKIINICAESKGPLVIGEVFSFGNGCKVVKCGCVMSYPGQILGMGLSSSRTSGEVTVAVTVWKGNQKYANPNKLPDGLQRNHYIFNTPEKFEAGDTIEFVSLCDNPTCTSTVVSATIELFIL